MAMLFVPSFAFGSGSNNPYSGGTVSSAIQFPDGSQSAPSATFSNATNTGVFNSTRPTISVAAANWNASTNIVTATGHGLWFNDQIRLTTTGSLPSGLSASTTYYVIWLTTNTFAFSTSYANSSSDVKVAFTTQGTGTHTITPIGISLTGTGSGNTTAQTSMTGVAANANNELIVTPSGIVVGQPHTPIQYPTEVIHAEQSSVASSGFDAADITITNSNTGSARFIATSGGVPSASGSPPSPNVQVYSIAYGASNSGTYWSGGPAITNSASLLVTGAADLVYACESCGSEQYLWNDGTHVRHHFTKGASGTEFAVISDTGTTLTGTTTNDSAATGFIGEFISSSTASGGAGATTSGNYSDLVSVTLTAGDWDVSMFVVCGLSGATGLTSETVGISTTAGNSGTGLVYGQTVTDMVPATGLYSPSSSIPLVRASLSGSTTYYLKVNASYSAGTPKFFGTISARRRR